MIHNSFKIVLSNTTIKQENATITMLNEISVIEERELQPVLTSLMFMFLFYREKNRKNVLVFTLMEIEQLMLSYFYLYAFL